MANYTLAATLGIATVAVFAWAKPDALQHLLTRCGGDMGKGRQKRPPPIEGLSDPDPLHDFDLSTATMRNRMYANKVSYGALRICNYIHDVLHRPFDSRTSRPWHTSPCTSTTGSSLIVTMTGELLLDS
jgi:hypothetical protein